MHPQQNKQQFDIYETVTNQIIQALEKGTIPWRKPWGDYGPPMNLVSRRYYTGVNYLLLMNLPYEMPFYLTFNQVKAAGGAVLPGEKGQLIVWRKLVEIKDEVSGKVSKKFSTQYYIVFNVAQCNNIPEGLVPTLTVRKTKKEPVEICERVVESYEACPTIKHDGTSAYYMPSEDYINMPPLEYFLTSDGYYSVLFHELIHSTGHRKRLGRKEVMDEITFGSEPYSVEELVAEIGACYLNAFCKLPFEEMDNNTAYIASWLERLKNDKKFIIQASFRAQKAVDYILGVQRDEKNWEALPGENIE